MHYSPEPMHIPDGFLSAAVSVLLWIIIILVIAYTLRRVSADLDERKVPLMGVLAAAIFAGQMLNFTVAGGTSGHLMGAALASILLGPWAAILVMTVVIGVQALILQDGGLLALGANIFNMALIGVLISHTAYQTAARLARGQKWGIFAGGFIAGWLSVLLSALAVALELAVSRTSPANIAVPTMGGIHALIGIGEGLITLGALAFLYSVRPDMIKPGMQQKAGGAAVWAVGLLIALALAVASPLASSNPDGLTRFAAQAGFLDAAQEAPYSILPNYLFPGVSNETLATILAGVIGTLIVFAAALVIAYLRRSQRRSSQQD